MKYEIFRELQERFKGFYTYYIDGFKIEKGHGAAYCDGSDGRNMLKTKENFPL